MTSAAKQQFSGMVCVLGVVVMSFCISRMIPHGLAGNLAGAKLYFILMMVAFVCSLPAGLAYYYYGGRIEADQAFERKRIETETLSHSAPKSVGQKQTVPEPNRSARGAKSGPRLAP